MRGAVGGMVRLWSDVFAAVPRDEKIYEGCSGHKYDINHLHL